MESLRNLGIELLCLGVIGEMLAHKGIGEDHHSFNELVGNICICFGSVACHVSCCRVYFKSDLWNTQRLFGIQGRKGLDIGKLGSRRIFNKDQSLFIGIGFSIDNHILIDIIGLDRHCAWFKSNIDRDDLAKGAHF